MAKIPATVITGFLGAGKTTLIRNLIMGTRGTRIALVINEFGDLGVDAALLEGCGNPDCGEDDIFELPNGCICCTVADDFIPTIEKILDRPERPHHIVIETSGLALPKPLVQAFNWPEIRTRVTVDGVVTVVDSAAVADGRFADDPDSVDAQRRADDMLDHESPLEELFEDQLSCADLVLLNKSDLVDDSEMATVVETVGAHLRPGVKFLSTRNGDASAAALLGLGMSAENDLLARPSHHDNEEEHDHDEFESFAVETEAVTDPEDLARRVSAAIAAHGIYRVKGFAAVVGKDMRLVVQGVGARVDHYYQRGWREDEARRTRLVVIGQSGLDRDAIQAAIAG